jgi:hypothetical protein
MNPNNIIDGSAASRPSNPELRPKWSKQNCNKGSEPLDANNVRCGIATKPTKQTKVDKNITKLKKHF